MEMSPEHMRDTAEHLAARGFQYRQTEARYGERIATQHRLTREGVAFTLESFSDGPHPHYFLEIENYHGLRSTSFPLDSWRHFDGHVEFKYYVLDENALGLSFIVELDAPS